MIRRPPRSTLFPYTNALPISAIVLATALGSYLFTRFLIPDTLVGLWLILGFYFFLRSLEEDPPSRLTCWGDRKSTRLNSSHSQISYAVFCLKKKNHIDVELHL